MPKKKGGMESTSMTPESVPTSLRRPRRHAERKPRSVPISTASTTELPTRSTVQPIRSPITSTTGCPYGLDEPIPAEFERYISGLATGDLQISIR